MAPRRDHSPEARGGDDDDDDDGWGSVEPDAVGTVEGSSEASDDEDDVGGGTRAGVSSLKPSRGMTIRRSSAAMTSSTTTSSTGGRRARSTRVSSTGSEKGLVM